MKNSQASLESMSPKTDFNLKTFQIAEALTQKRENIQSGALEAQQMYDKLF